MAKMGALARVLAIALAGVSGGSCGAAPAEQQRAPAQRTVVDPARIGMFDRGDYLLGVQTHFVLNRDMGYDPAPVARSIRDLGFRSFRDGIYWHTFSPSWDAEGAHLNRKLEAFLNMGVARPLLVINGSNPRVPNSSPPMTDAARAAFGAYAQRAVGATRKYGAMYEIWNEWNRTANPMMTAMKDRGATNDSRYAGNYAKLAIAASSAIKARYPDAKVLVGAAATDWDWDWTETIVDQGALTKADGLSVHVYNQCYAYKRGADELIGRLNALQGRVRKHTGRPVDIYVTEWGWSTGQACPPPGTMVIDASSQFMFATAATPWMKGIWQYELKNKSTNQREVEDNFGVVDDRFADKPATCAIRQSLALLNGVRRIGMTRVDDKLTVVYGTRPDGNFAVIWTNSKVGGSSALIGGTDDFTVQPICGDKAPGAGNRQVPVGRTPVVVRLGRGLPRIGVLAR